MKSIKNEYIKIWSIKNILILIALFSLLNIVQVGISYVPYDNWKKNAIELRVLYEETIQIMNETQDRNSIFGSIEDYRNSISCIDYALENNFEYGVPDMWSHIFNMKQYQILFIVIMVIFTSYIISNEYEKKTWKNLCTTSKSKAEIIIEKYIYAFIQCLFLTIFLLFISGIIGFIVFGWGNGGNILKSVEGKVVIENILLSILLTYFFVFLKTLFYSSITFCLNITTKNSKVALAFALALFLLNNNINDLLSKIKINDFLPFKYIQLFSQNILTNFTVIGLCIIIIYQLLILITSSFIFLKSDIK